MTPYDAISILWVAFVLYWIAAAFSAKRYARRNYGTWLVRILIIVVIVIFLNLPGMHAVLIAGNGVVLSPAWQWLGVFLCACGVAFAIWARVYLGRNWGMPMTLREGHELVTTGPYAYVRHPIYTGFMLAALGSSLVTLWWTIPFIALSLYFVFAALSEEVTMKKEFPDQYSEYMKRTKMLIPFVF